MSTTSPPPVSSSTDPTPQASPSPQQPTLNTTIPPTHANIRFLLINNSRSDILFPPTTTIHTIKQAILTTWPEIFGPKPSGVECVRILWKGKFLEDEKTVQGCGMGLGETTIVHLLVKEVGSGGSERVESKNEPASNTSSCCAIL